MNALTLLECKRHSNVYHLVYEIDRLRSEQLPLMGKTVEVAAVSQIDCPESQYPYDSICISISTGCYRTPGCIYCATGMTSEVKNIRNQRLLTSEITDQVVLTLEKIRDEHKTFGAGKLSVSFMGKGEPGLNAKLVIGSLAELYNLKLISHSSISTTGLPIYFKSIAKEYLDLQNRFPAPYLQVSIHAASDTQRISLVTNPSSILPIESVLESAIEDYSLQIAQGRKIAIRLILMRWDNQCNYDAQSLDDLARLFHMFNERYSINGFEGFFVVASLLNEITDGSNGKKVISGSVEDLEKVIEELNTRGIIARKFANDSNTESVCTCGTFQQLE